MCPETGDGRPRYDLVIWCDDCTHGRHSLEGCLGRDGRRVGGYDTLDEAKRAGYVETIGHLAWEFTVRERGKVVYNSSDATWNPPDP
jgi:hypothetical protein